MAAATDASIETLWKVFENVIEILNGHLDTDMVFHSTHLGEALKNERFKAIFERLEPRFKNMLKIRFNIE